MSFTCRRTKEDEKRWRELVGPSYKRRVWRLRNHSRRKNKVSTINETKNL